MMKRIFILLVLLSTLFISGCSDKKENSEINNTVNTTLPITVTETTVSTTATTQPATTAPQGELEGCKILVDAGHGCTKEYWEPIGPGSAETRQEGPSTGTSGVVSKKHEGELTLALALKLQKKLESEGAEVIMVRTTKGTPLSLQQRAELGNKNNVDLAFRIHADGVDNSTANGASVLYPTADYVGNDISAESKKAAQCMLDEYIRCTGLYNRGTVARGDLTGFNFSTVPTILIEVGFMTNPEEDQKMWEDDFQKKMVNGMYSGIKSYELTVKK